MAFQNCSAPQPPGEFRTPFRAAALSAYLKVEIQSMRLACGEKEKHISSGLHQRFIEHSGKASRSFCIPASVTLVS